MPWLFFVEGSWLGGLDYSVEGSWVAFSASVANFLIFYILTICVCYILGAKIFIDWQKLYYVMSEFCPYFPICNKISEEKMFSFKDPLYFLSRNENKNMILNPITRIEILI